MDSYKYRFSATERKKEFRDLLAGDLKELGLNATLTNDSVTIEGEASFEKCMQYVSKFLSYKNHELYLFKRG